MMNWLVDADVTEPDITPEVVASGGTETVITVAGRPYRVHTFTSNGTFTVTTAGKIECFLVGGGGAGGQSIGDFDYTDTSLGQFGAVYIATGGGGGGGVVTAELELSSTGAYAVTVGAGGQIDTTLSDGVPLDDPTVLNGGDSKIAFGGSDLVIATGGGGGAVNRYPDSTYAFYTDGQDGGSGGGGLSSFRTEDVTVSPLVASEFTATDGGASILNQGNNGADGDFQINQGANRGDENGIAGGGGGAFAQGGNVDAQIADSTEPNPSGGNGIQSNFDGTLKTYAGGGGGAIYSNFGGMGAGGQGGGGNSSNRVPFTIFSPSTAGTDGLGGGGGGATTIVPGQAFKDAFEIDGVVTNQASDGGSGIVIIRYPIEG